MVAHRRTTYIGLPEIKSHLPAGSNTKVLHRPGLSWQRLQAEPPESYYGCMRIPSLVCRPVSIGNDLLRRLRRLLPRHGRLLLGPSDCRPENEFDNMVEERNLEARLRASQLYNRSIIEACPAAMLVVDPELDITDVNERAVNLTGYSRRELIGSPIEDHFILPEEADDAVRKTLDTGEVSRFELILRPRSGDERAVPINASMFHDPAGARRGLFVAAV
jgi:PAS domain S-box-containing protein